MTSFLTQHLFQLCMELLLLHLQRTQSDIMAIIGVIRTRKVVAICFLLYANTFVSLSYDEKQ